MNLDGQLQQIIDELLAHGISLDLAEERIREEVHRRRGETIFGKPRPRRSSLGIHRNTLRNKVGILNIRLPRDSGPVSPDIHKKK